MTIIIEKYSQSLKEEWDSFVDTAKNGLFMFKRDYMEYHKDRFEDFSLVISQDNNIIALLPGNIKENILYSHQGLTYGGLIHNEKISSVDIVKVFEELKKFIIKNKIKGFFYKATSYIFHKYPAQEDLYALSRIGATLYRTDLSSVIDFTSTPGFNHGKKSAVNKAKKNELEIKRSTDFKTFFEKIVNPTLHDKYKTAATHTYDEMALLNKKFPENILLYNVTQNGEVVAGSIVFDFGNVVHTQYLFSDDKGKELRAIELMVDHLIERYKTTAHYFSFGISTENEGKVLNEGLIKYKEEFGASAVVNQHYKLEL